jgi:hypothetical protein
MKRVTKESLAAVGITGGLAVTIFVAVLLLVLGLSLGIFALAGVVVAYVWNTFVVTNVDADLPTLLWWQASLILLGLRMLFGLIMPTRVSS